MLSTITGQLKKKTKALHQQQNPPLLDHLVKSTTYLPSSIKLKPLTSPFYYKEKVEQVKTTYHDKIHESGNVKNGPFINLNCAAIPEKFN